MSLGSPALAAYSLVLTSLNARSVYHRVKASRVRYKKSVMDVLVSIQQTSLELTEDGRLLEFIQDNHRWIQEIGERLSRRGTWSLATATSIAWVIISFLLTLVDSFVSLDRSSGNTAVGHAVGTVWLWLLCLVIGWMWVPIFGGGELKTVLDSANRRVVKRAAKRIKKTGAAAKRLVSLARDKLANRPAQAMGNRGDPGDSGQEPDQSPNPTLNPSGRKGTDRVNSIPAESHFSQDKMDPKVDQLLKLKNLGSLNRDERRLSATFNYSRTIGYLVLVDDILRALDRVARKEYEVGLSRKCQTEVVSIIFNRRGLPLETLPLRSLRRRLFSLEERSSRCSTRRLWPSFSSAGQPLQP